MESAEVSAVLHELTAGPSAARPTPKRSFLPEFADERNRELDTDIQAGGQGRRRGLRGSALEAEMERTQIALDENDEHTRVLAEHLDSVRLEIKHTQTRLTARTREVEGEAHLRAVAERESGRLRSDAARLAARRAELAQRVTVMETEAFTAGERLDQFRLVQNWNQEELEQWAAAAKAKEEDRLALERYRRQDEAKVKELGMQLERATREVQQGKRDLEDALTETQAAQGELGKAAQDFRRLHAERAELLTQWEAVAEAVRRRDAEILAAGQEVAERKARLAGLQLELAGQTAQLDAEVAAGAAIQKRIAARERQIKAHYDAYHTSQASAADAEDALDLMANSLGAAEDEAQRGAAACGHLRAELERRRAAVEAAQGKLEAARVRLALEGRQLGSLQQKVQELEGLHAEEAKRGEALERELAALAQRQFRASQALHEAQEVQYTADSQVVQMERRMARAEGHRSKDETEALTARIKALEAQLQEATSAHGTLVDEVKRAEDDYARAQRASQAVQGERAGIMDDMARLTVEAAAVGRALKAAAKEREGKLVEVDLKKLEAGEVESLEVRRRALEGGMRERRAEVEVQLELMQNEARLLRDEVRCVTLELQARQLSLSKLQKKHEALVLKGRGQDGEEAHSQAYYIIKAAQERQELAEQVEALRGQIFQAERECRALEGTLRRLLGSNSDWSFQARHAGAHDQVEEQAALKAQLDAAAAQLRGKQAEEARRSAELEEVRASCLDL
ncbi:flagella associated isoform B [Chlorella sorokiniana]|uniref:Flagella associated isoform B n=1 Tax=Chlorella sorokiniana TaxID=3076 RepID=A0A2P6TN56_CHLSO|nr:flagella associated isoform B [Chlorella sorokiniana]|eukprot:PRW50762.1 flagella associated isoform B [Chlorella sorokiniana]